MPAVRIYLVALFATICLFILYFFLNTHLEGSYWQTLQQSKSALTGEYCEQDQLTHFFRQTMNTYSNLMYFFLGTIVVLISFFDRKKDEITAKNGLQKFPLLSLFFGCCLMYLCFGSSFFHASLTWMGQRVDMNATYSICISLIGISCYRFFSKGELLFQSKHQGFIILLLTVTVAVFIELHLRISSLILLPVLILWITLFTTLNYLKNKNGFKIQFALLSFLLMMGAFILRTLDVQKIACDPNSFYQGHALWHIFTGMSSFFLYWFYRTEKIN